MDVTKTGNGKRVTSTGDWKMKKKKGRKQRIGNKATERARVQVRICSHFSFSRSRSPL